MWHAQEEMCSQGENHIEEGGADNTKVGRQQRRI